MPNRCPALAAFRLLLSDRRIMTLDVFRLTVRGTVA
jgi:hypothetical protein